MSIVNLVIILLSVIALFLSSERDKTFNLQRSKLLKAVLPYGVILGHLSAYNNNVFSIAIVGSFIVGVFFFISAYGLEYKRQNGTLSIQGLWKRIMKLIVPLIIPIIIYIIVLAIKGQNALLIVYENLTTYQFILPFTWFVIILAIFYAFFYLLSAIHQISENHFFILLTICVCCFSIANFLIFRDSAYTNFSSLCFPAGVFYRQHEAKIEQFLCKRINYILCLLILFLTSFVVTIHNLLPFTILIWSIIIIMLSTLINVKVSKLLSFFSKISYEVYVCQGITYLFIPQHFDNYSPIWHILLTIILTITIATICNFVTNQLRLWITSRNKLLNTNKYS
ncbi:MAG: acyltransferase family protein [Muribaculaceae bacterium]|nr:acyltransferase family protein [Muribaculaceae bacterium]